MATKTITLELDAYEKLRNAKRNPSESFTSVVRRATFPDEPITAGELLDDLLGRMRSRVGLVDEETLERLDAAQAQPRISESAWK